MTEDGDLTDADPELDEVAGAIASELVGFDVGVDLWHLTRARMCASL